MRHLPIVVAITLGFLVGAASAQSRSVTLDGSGIAMNELHCARNTDGSWDCWGCGTVASTLDDGTGPVASIERLCSARPRTLKTANSNRVQTVADALGPSVLRQAGFATVDAGSP